MRRYFAALALLVVLSGCTLSPEVSENPDPAQVSAEPTEDHREGAPDGHFVCVQDGDPDLEMAYTIADVTNPEVVIDASKVYTVKENTFPRTGFIIVGSDAGVLHIYMDANGNLYAANDVAEENTILRAPEDVGLDPIDKSSDVYDRVQRCIP